jgi:hypothetical protein
MCRAAWVRPQCAALSLASRTAREAAQTRNPEYLHKCHRKRIRSGSRETGNLSDLFFSTLSHPFLCFFPSKQCMYEEVPFPIFRFGETLIFVLVIFIQVHRFKEWRPETMWSSGWPHFGKQLFVGTSAMLVASSQPEMRIARKRVSCAVRSADSASLSLAGCP